MIRSAGTALAIVAVLAGGAATASGASLYGWWEMSSRVVSCHYDGKPCTNAGGWHSVLWHITGRGGAVRHVTILVDTPQRLVLHRRGSTWVADERGPIESCGLTGPLMGHGHFHAALRRLGYTIQGLTSAVSTTRCSGKGRPDRLRATFALRGWRVLR